MRIIELEKERDCALALVQHVHERDQSEAQQLELRQQLYERHIQASENEIRQQQAHALALRGEAAQAVLHVGQQSQGEMFDMAKECHRLTQMMHQKATGNAALQSDLMLAEQLMLEAKEAVKLSESREAFIADETAMRPRKRTSRKSNEQGA